jgi:flavin reductase (DIM6/NTAB) family NADH-FMN oxidoreductase RutF
MKKSLGAKLPAYPVPVWVIGTYDEAGNPNAATVAWAGIACSDPPAVSISLRKATYTYGNIIRSNAFTVNIPSQKNIQETDCLGMVSGKEVDKFALTGLTPVRSALIEAPYIAEFPLVLECKLLHTVEIGFHTQFVGQILDTMLEDDFADAKGRPDLQKIKPFLFALPYYYNLGEPAGKVYSLGKDMANTR